MFVWAEIFIFSKLFKRFYLPILMTLPIAIGSSFSCLLPPHILSVEGQGLFNMYLEFLVRRSRFTLVKHMRESRVAAIVMFSVLHTCVIFGFLKPSKKFWFTSMRLEVEADPSCKTNKCRIIHGSSSCCEYFKKVRIFFCQAFGSICKYNNRNWLKQRNLHLGFALQKCFRIFSRCATTLWRFQACLKINLITVCCCFWWASMEFLR